MHIDMSSLRGKSVEEAVEILRHSLGLTTDFDSSQLCEICDRLAREIRSFPEYVEED